MKRSNYEKMLHNGVSKLSVFMFALAVVFFTASCDDEEVGTLPTTVTGEVTEIADIYATVSGTVTDNGGADILAMGICWTDEDREPTTMDNFVPVGKFTLDGIAEEYWNYSITLNGLTAQSEYKVRAYAANEAGTSYGETISFSTKAGKTFHALTPDMIDTYTQEESEGPKEALVDNNFDTYWHSAWSDGVAPLPHHIQITFAEAKNIGGFQFWTRSTGTRGNDPVQFDVQTSADGVDYTTVWTSDVLETATRPDVNTVSLDKNYSAKYFRIRIIETRTPGLTHTTMSEFKVFDDGLLAY
jgi:hypothetical protein